MFCNVSSWAPDFSEMKRLGMTFNDYANMFFIKNGYFTINPEAFDLPEIKRMDGYATISAYSSLDPRRNWIAPHIYAIIEGKMKGWEGREDGWKYHQGHHPGHRHVAQQPHLEEGQLQPRDLCRMAHGPEQRP